jgi:hypothetical protein
MLDPGFGDFWRLDGPGYLRLILQPLTAILLGIRDGHLDAKSGLLPLHSRLFSAGHGSRALRAGLTAIVIPLSLSVVTDGVVQYLVHDFVHPVAALVVGILLVGIPYAVIRGSTNELLRRVRPDRYGRCRQAEMEQHHGAASRK